MFNNNITDMTTAQIEAENTQMTNDLYRLLKKYTGLRNLIRELKVNNCNNSKLWETLACCSITR